MAVNNEKALKTCMGTLSSMTGSGWVKTWTRFYSTATAFKIIQGYFSCRFKDISQVQRNTEGPPPFRDGQ